MKAAALILTIIFCHGCAVESDLEHAEKMAAHWDQVRCEQAQGMGIYPGNCK